MPHWKSIDIKSFRRLKNLRIDNLGAVNLFVGKNNSGKTSLLEALAITSNPADPLTWIDIGREREMKSARTPALEVLSWFFPHTAPRKNGFDGAIAIEGVLTSGNTLKVDAGYREYRAIQITTPSTDTPEPSSDEEVSEYTGELLVEVKRFGVDGCLVEHRTTTNEFSGKQFKNTGSAVPLFPFQFVSPVSHRTSRQLLVAVDQIIEERLKDEVIGLMKMLAPDVDDIEIRSPEGRGAVVHLHHSQIGHVPLSVEGDGMRRALAFAAAAAQAKNGVLLVDEVETALHPDALGGIFRFLVQVCRASGVQLFVSTHSLEAVDAMLVSMGADVDDLVAYHLPSRESALGAYRLSGKSIHEMRNEGGFDLR